jgi:hypothetical protein
MISVAQLRQSRIFNMAIFDLVLTFIGAFITHLLMWLYPLDINAINQEKRTFLQYIISLVFIFLTFVGIGVIIHRIFGIKSALSAYLGFNSVPLR